MPKLASPLSTRGGKLVLLAFVIVAACEMGVVGLGLEPESIELDITEVELETGHDVVIQATVRDRTGEVVEVGRGWGVDWSTSDAGIAAVEAMVKGAARAIAGHGGTAEVTATVVHSVSVAGLAGLFQSAVPRGRALGHLKASATVSVGPSDLQYVGGSDQSAPVGAEVPEDLAVRAVNAEGDGVPNVEIEFRVKAQGGSIDPVTVLTDAEGLASTRWTLGGVPGEMAVAAEAAIRKHKLPTIEFTAIAFEENEDESDGGEGIGGGGEPQVASVHVEPGSQTINAIGDAVQFTAEARDEDGSVVSDASISWSSEDSQVATVDQKGRVVAKQVGSTRIVATVESVSGDAVVNVQQVPASVTISPSSVILDEGDSKQLTATAEDSNGVIIPDASFVWSSSDTNVAMVSDTGVVTGRHEGTAEVAAKTAEVSAKATVAVEGISPPPPPSDFLPAFPGAEGWGAYALNECRSKPLVVHRVTNTNDSGSGSFRDIVENQVSSSNFDVVIFTTGGLIQHSGSTLESRADCVYVAGQTAPGGGITMTHARVSFSNHRDIVVRHLRHRGQGRRGFASFGGSRIIWDHVTASWSAVDGSSGSYPFRLGGFPRERQDSVTVQNSLIYEPGEGHPTAFGVAGGLKDNPQHLRISVHRNALMGPAHRIPMCSALEVSITNNVIYNWTGRGSESNNTATCDWINNYHKPGPATNLGGSWAGRPINLGDGCSGDGDGACFWSFYVSGNINHINNFGARPDEPWEGSTRYVGCRNTGGDPEGWCSSNGGVVPVEFRRAHPFPAQPAILSLRAMTSALRDEILDTAGHSRRLSCDGSWVDIRESTDQQRVDQFYAGTGPSSPVDVTEMVAPVPSRGTPCKDSDGDGIPDEYELRYSGSATGLRADMRTGSGYLAIELYLAGLPPDWMP